MLEDCSYSLMHQLKMGETQHLVTVVTFPILFLSVGRASLIWTLIHARSILMNLIRGMYQTEMKDDSASHNLKIVCEL